MADFGVRGTRTDVAAGEYETPAIICARCRRGTPLASLRPDVEVPRCRHCGARLAGFGAVEVSEIERRAIVAELVDALEAGDVDAAAAHLRSDVVWQEAPSGPTIAGRDALVERWRSAPVSRTLGSLTVVDEVVLGLVLEHDRTSGDDRLVRWFVGFEGELIVSCWVWNLQRRDETRALRAG